MYRVLIVDDEPFILEGLKNLINWEEYGLEIIETALDGIQASKIIENNKINILITDLRMSKMSGLELIKFVKEKSPDTKCIILSGYDDFEYVKAAAQLGIENYLLKPVNKVELCSTLLNTVNKIESDLYKQIHQREDINIIKNNLLLMWLNNNINSQDLSQKSELLDINLDCTQYIVALIKIIHTGEKSPNDGLMSFAANNIVNELLWDAKTGMSFCEHNGDIVIIFTDYRGDMELSTIKKILIKCQSNINTFLHLNVFTTIGSIETEKSCVHQSYSNAKYLMEYSLIYSYNTIICHNEITESATHQESQVNIDFNTLNAYLIAKDKKQATDFIKDIYFNQKDSWGFQPSHIQKITVEILFNIISTVRSLNRNTDKLLDDSKDLFSSVYKLKTIDKLVEELNGIIIKCIDYLIQQENGTNLHIKKIFAYVNNNFSKDINLKTISSHFNISPAYLGQLFRSETKDTFTNYVNTIRIQKAKEMLVNTNLKANEISELIGYTNANYFYTIFKKVTGVSPTEYKNK